MFLSNASLRRPVAMGTVIIALVLLGVNSYRKLGLENLPKMEAPYVTVVTTYPGATPEEVESDIAKKIEDAVASIDGLKHVTSSCMENVCQTLIEFEDEVDADVAASDVRDKVDLIQNDLPADAEQPKVLKFDINANPIIYLALTGDAPLDDLYDYADNELRDRLSSIAGVAETQLVGGAEREVHVLLRRDELAARGLTSVNVVEALQEGVRKIPAGRLRDSGTEYAVKFDAEYENAADIASLEIANQDGARCYIRDVADVQMGTEELRQAAFLDGKPAISIRVVKKADANAVKVVNRVRQEFADIQSALPAGMKLEWITDDGTFIEATVSSTWSDILKGVALTAVILFLFLYNLRSTLIVAVTMPLTIVIGLFFIYLCGYTLNLSTLLSIGLCVGILVTNSIVVVESIVSRLSKDPDPKAAARTGAGEVAVAVLASAGTNIVVLFPIGMMGGRVGQFFSPFAYTMVIVTAVSVFISFTLTPILGALLLKRAAPGARRGLLQRLEVRWNRLFSRLENVYGAALSHLAEHRVTTAGLVVLSGVLLVHAFTLVSKVGFSFVEDNDRGQIFVKLEYPTRYSLDRTVARAKEVESALTTLPTLQSVLTTTGKVEGVIGQSSEGAYLAQILLTFVDKTQRTETIDALLDEVRRRMAGYPDCIVSINTPMIVGGQTKPIEMEIAGDELDELDRLATAVTALAHGVPGVTDVDNSVRIGKPELRIQPNRAILSDLNAPAVGIGQSLRGNIEGIKAATFKRGARSYDIRVKLLEEQGKDQVEEFLFPGAPGQPITLAALASVEESTAPVQITRNDKRRISKVYANVVGATPLGTAVNGINRQIKENVAMPKGFRHRYVGMYEAMQESNTAFMEAGILSILLTYLLLAAILESFVQPFIILVTIPLGLIGIIWGLYLTGQSLSIFALLGSVMLVGIVVNNAILVMHRVNQLREDGLTPRDAMVQAAKDELRPVVMITAAAILGMLPLATATGLGSENRVSIGIAAIGGLAISAALSLLIVPALYELFARRTPRARS